jgi:restriction endonuclease S subunit
MQRATKVGTLNKDSIVDVEVPFPPEPERKKIVEMMRAKDEEMDRQNKILYELHEKKAIILKEALA